MKRLILMLVLISAGFVGSARDKETRQERIRRWKNDMEAFQQRQMKSMAVYDVADSLKGASARNALENAGFVLEADAVTFMEYLMLPRLSSVISTPETVPSTVTPPTPLGPE